MLCPTHEIPDTLCYAATRGLKRDDQSVLGFEIRKSCVSIPSNIAEGFGRHHTAEYVHHLRYANASGNELQTQLELAHRAGLMREAEVAHWWPPLKKSAECCMD